MQISNGQTTPLKIHSSPTTQLYTYNFNINSNMLEKFRNKTEVQNTTPGFQLKWIKIQLFQNWTDDRRSKSARGDPFQKWDVGHRRQDWRKQFAAFFHYSCRHRIETAVFTRSTANEIRDLLSGTLQTILKEGTHVMEISGGARCSVPTWIASTFPWKKSTVRHRQNHCRAPPTVHPLKSDWRHDAMIMSIVSYVFYSVVVKMHHMHIL